jgi:hypothetical protein
MIRKACQLMIEATISVLSFNKLYNSFLKFMALSKKEFSLKKKNFIKTCKKEVITKISIKLKKNRIVPNFNNHKCLKK